MYRYFLNMQKHADMFETFSTLTTLTASFQDLSWQSPGRWMESRLGEFKAGSQRFPRLGWAGLGGPQPASGRDKAPLASAGV